MYFCLKEGSVGGITFYFITFFLWIIIEVVAFRFQKDYRPEWENNFIKFLFNKDEPVFSACNSIIILMLIFNIMRVICTLIYGYAPEG